MDSTSRRKLRPYHLRCHVSSPCQQEEILPILPIKMEFVSRFATARPTEESCAGPHAPIFPLSGSELLLPISLRCSSSLCLSGSASGTKANTVTSCISIHPNKDRRLLYHSEPVCFRNGPPQAGIVSYSAA